MSDYKMSTKCVQSGYTPGNGEPRQIPIVQSTTFKYATSEDMGKLFDLEAEGYFYSRLQNPTCDHVAKKIAELEGGATNGASVLTQSNEIRDAIPKVIEAAEKEGYHIDSMGIAGGSAGHTLAMIYAYRDAGEAPVPVAFTFGGVGPSCFYKEDWDNYGFDRETEESYQGAAGIFSAMLGEMLSVEEIKDGSYLEKMIPISAAE